MDGIVKVKEEYYCHQNYTGVIYLQIKRKPWKLITSSKGLFMSTHNILIGYVTTWMVKNILRSLSQLWDKFYSDH